MAPDVLLFHVQNIFVMIKYCVYEVVHTDQIYTVQALVFAFLCCWTQRGLQNENSRY